MPPKDEILALLNVIRPGRDRDDRLYETYDRNRAIILLLLDTGIRASELCNLLVHACDLKHQHVHVLGKGAKERTVPFSADTGDAIWRYLSSREQAHAGSHLFVTLNENPFERRYLANMLSDIGERADIADANPHRFRHTFAIRYLKNGGDPYTLRMLLGHGSMDMVRRYLHLSQVDLDRGHQGASPVANWKLGRH